MTKVHITGTGLFTPKESVSNEELVTAFNAYVENFNAEHAGEIEAGTVEALDPSSVEFIEKASGIKSRFVMNKSGIIDPEVMCPRLPERSNDEPSILAEMSVLAAYEGQDSLLRAFRAGKRHQGAVRASVLQDASSAFLVLAFCRSWSWVRRASISA